MDDLNYLNYLNLVGYVINVLVTFGASRAFGFPDNADLSDKYQTLISPPGFTFSIWGVIFLSQAIFTVFQMLPGFRSNKLVQDGVSYWYFVTCLVQSAWNFAFGYEVIWLSVIFMFGILAPLTIIVVRQSEIESAPDSVNKDFWLYKFPFSLHCGWISVAFAVNVNVWIDAIGASANTQEYCAYASLVYAILVAVFAFVYLSPPDFTIPSVLVWATLGIAIELTDPKDSIISRFEEEVIKRVRIIIIVVASVLALVTTSYGIYRVVVKRTRTNGNYTSIS